METQIYDTVLHPLMRRGDNWLDEVRARHLGVCGKTHVSNDPFFYGCMQRAADVSRMTHDRLVISIERGKGAVWRQQGRELKLDHGDILVANPDEPYIMSTTGYFAMASFYLPRAMLQAHLCSGDLELPRVLSARASATVLASSFGMNLADHLPALEEPVAAFMIDSLARLVAVAAGATMAAHGEALRQARLEQAMRHIDANLADADLTPATCARALGISVRTLHLAFEPTGQSFVQTLLGRRLEQCRIALHNPIFAGRQIADIAFACGFGSLAGFYRAFARTYGARPGDMRQSCKSPDAAGWFAAASAD